MDKFAAEQFSDNFFSRKKKKKKDDAKKWTHIYFIFNLNSNKNSDFTKRNH